MHTMRTAIESVSSGCTKGPIDQLNSLLLRLLGNDFGIRFDCISRSRIQGSQSGLLVDHILTIRVILQSCQLDTTDHKARICTRSCKQGSHTRVKDLRTLLRLSLIAEKPRKPRKDFNPNYPQPPATAKKLNKL
ncbi:hypothetical protein L596_010783 [Steinernema carpocapsae]|uniref:Uncharacterized protein n=1 Tax=Steinernema carpocapsae TaxID=34508 RepID=A0A4U5PJI1_STECR|nr:hypothetical protein L596_010783 [Steinernema carpocapsae]